MSKYEFTIKTLGEKLHEIGGELYTLELVKADKNGEAMSLLFGGLMGKDNNRENFDELIEVISLLRDMDTTPPKENNNE